MCIPFCACQMTLIFFFFFLNYFQSHNLAMKKQEYFSFKKIINFYHRSEVLPKKYSQDNKRNVTIYPFANKNEEDDNDFVV